MLFLVPDDPPEKTDPDNEDGRAENEQSRDGTKLDDGSGNQSGRGGEKVELDLDDAPFLDEEEEEDSGKKEEEEEEQKKEKKQDKQPGASKKWWIIAGIAVLLVFVAVFLFFFFGEKEPRTKKPEAKKEKKAEQPQEEPRESITLEKFQVAHETENGTVFLNCRFTMNTNSSKLAWEINRKKTVLRDAIYYYLKKQDLIFLRDKQNADNLKKDLLSVVNQYLSNGKLSRLLIEEYFIK